MPSWEIPVLNDCRAAGLKGRDQDTALVIARRWKPHYRAVYVSLEELAAETGLGLRNAWRAVRRLEAAGIYEVEHHMGRKPGSRKGRYKGQANVYRRADNYVKSDGVINYVKTDVVSRSVTTSKLTGSNGRGEFSNYVKTDVASSEDGALQAQHPPRGYGGKDAADSLRSAAPLNGSLTPAAVGPAALQAETPEQGWALEQTLGDLARTQRDFFNDWHKARTRGSASHAPRKGAVAHLLETPLSRPAPELELPDPRTRRRHP